METVFSNTFGEVGSGVCVGVLYVRVCAFQMTPYEADGYYISLCL